MVEIHGQHEHRALVTAGAQRNVLDAFAGTDLGALRALQAELREVDGALGALGGDEQQPPGRPTSFAIRCTRSM